MKDIACTDRHFQKSKTEISRRNVSDGIFHRAFLLKSLIFIRSYSVNAKLRVAVFAVYSETLLLSVIEELRGDLLKERV